MNIRDLIPWSRERRDMSSRSSRQGGREVLARREASDPIFGLQSEIDRMFDNLWRRFDLPMLGGDDGMVTAIEPEVDIRETDKEVEVTAELPGMDDADVDVSVAQGMLTIRGEKKVEREDRDDGYVLRERSYGRVERIVPLPDGLDLDAAEASFKNGVLTVRIPKTAEAQATHRRIAVQRH